MADAVESGSVYAARLGLREKLFFLGLGCGVFLGIPLTLGVIFAVAFRTPEPLGMIVPFLAAFLLILMFRTTGYRLSGDRLEVLRPAGRRRFTLDRSAPAVPSPRLSEGPTFGVVRSSGFVGVSGSFWSREAGKFYVYVTDATRVVGLTCADGRRLFVSPVDSARFLAEASDAPVAPIPSSS